MQRRRFKQTDVLEDRLGAEAVRLRAEAEVLHLARRGTTFCRFAQTSRNRRSHE